MSQIQNLPLKLTALMMVSLIALAIFQSSALLTLTYDLEPSAFNERLVGIAEVWHSWMGIFGAAGLTEAISDIMVMIHETRVSEDI